MESPVAESRGEVQPPVFTGEPTTAQLAAAGRLPGEDLNAGVDTEADVIGFGRKQVPNYESGIGESLDGQPAYGHQ